MRRAFWNGFASLLLLAVVTPPVRADLPGPYPWSKRPERPRPSIQYPDPVTEGAVVPSEPPVTPRPVTGGAKRTGPFRSCGSGAGTGLAAVGVSWGLLWLGTRAAGRVRGTKG